MQYSAMIFTILIIIFKTLKQRKGMRTDTFRTQRCFALTKTEISFVGAVNIRHYLNETLLKTGGHIGDGIRPSERRKGYATAMISLALQECRKLGISRVLMCCDRNNIGSAKSIIRNGGVLENEVVEDGVPVQRYWIRV